MVAFCAIGLTCVAEDQDAEFGHTITGRPTGHILLVGRHSGCDAERDLYEEPSEQVLMVRVAGLSHLGGNQRARFAVGDAL